MRSNPPPVLEGGDRISALLREIDWSVHALGPPERWPASLVGVLTILLQASEPMILKWGPLRVCLYNEAAIPLFGTMHPTALAGCDREPIQAAATAAMRVLIVDDNQDAADSMQSLLGILGIETRTAYRGADALALVDGWVPSVILLDINMPDMDGYEVARRLRRLPPLAETLLIAVSGSGRPEDKRMAYEAGYNMHLVKPATLPALLAALGLG